MRRAAPLALVVLALSGCGGSPRPPAAVAKPPRLPHALAQAWVSESTAVAQALAAGDGCTALVHASNLRTDVDQAAGEIPARLRATLQPAIDALPGRITCNPAPPKPKPKHGKGHDKHDHAPPPHKEHG
jgi:hypothetical protein